MQFARYLERMGYLEELIAKESTGSPAQLAARLQISKRMLYRYIQEINENNTQGRRVDYNRVKESYTFL